jgi:hypothetical protein
MEGISAHSVSGQFRDNLCAAALCVFEFLEYKNAGSFSHDKTVALGIKRP